MLRSICLLALVLVFGCVQSEATMRLVSADVGSCEGCQNQCEELPPVPDAMLTRHEICVVRLPGESFSYDSFEFSDGTTTLLARSYRDDPEEVSYLGRRGPDGDGMLLDSDFPSALYQASRAYLISIGKTRIQILGPKGYRPESLEYRDGLPSTRPAV